MAARGEQALALCGRIADGLIISNMCPAEFTQAAVIAVREAARQAAAPVPAEVVQYIPCAVRPDRAEAYGLAKAALGGMLPCFWSLGERVPAAGSALLRAEELSQTDFAVAVARLRAGERPQRRSTIVSSSLRDRRHRRGRLAQARRYARRRERARAHLRRPAAGAGHGIWPQRFGALMPAGATAPPPPRRPAWPIGPSPAGSAPAASGRRAAPRCAHWCRACRRDRACAARS